MPIFHKLKIQFLMDVTHPKLLNVEGTGNIYPHNVRYYYPLRHIIPQVINFYLHSCQNLTSRNFLNLPQSTLWEPHKL